MTGFVIRESVLRAIVLSFSIAGVTLLAVISMLSDVDRVDISELSDHIGNEVECDGILIGARHMDTGSASLLVMQGNDTLEVYIERSDQPVSPGDHLRIRGEPFKIGERVQMTVQSDRSVRILDRGDPIPMEKNSETNEVYSVSGTMMTCRSWGEDDFSGSMYIDDDRSGSFLVNIDGKEVDVIPRSGDLVNVTGALIETGSLMIFGDNVQILSSPGARATHLLQIIQDLETDPGNIPLGPVSLQCYPRYEPSGRSLYIGEEPDGSRISIRVNTEYEIEGIHKGDLVQIVNGTLSWNPESIRYEIEAPVIRVINPHGPWMINLASLEWGVSEYEGCTVRLQGDLIKESDGWVLSDEGRSIDVRKMGSEEIQEDGWIEGVIHFDPDTNRYYLEAVGM